MVVHRTLGDPENAGNLPRRLPLAGPEQALGLPLRQGLLGSIFPHAAAHDPDRRLEDVVGHPGEDGRGLQHQVARRPLPGDERQYAVLSRRAVQRERDAVAQPELRRQSHHVHAPLLQEARLLVQSVPVDRQGLLAGKLDDGVAGQHVVRRIGLHPGVGALVEQHDLGPLHRHGQDERKAIVVVAHTPRETTDQLGQPVAIGHQSEMFQILKQLVACHGQASPGQGLGL